MAGESSDIKITTEEFEKISSALKNKEFRDLFFEYAKELEDPEKKKLYEEEIIALEKQRGSDVKFVKPKPGYVIKTVETKENKKVFINICSSDLVEKASSTCATKNNKLGQRWSVPHILVPPREDVDKGGKKCHVYDVAYHEDTLALAFKDHRFKNLVNTIAVQEIEKQHGLKLDSNNLKFPKMKYKGTPRSSVIRSKIDNAEEVADVDIAGIKVPYPSVQKKNVESLHEDGEEIVDSPTSNDPSKTIPKYRVIHRGHFDMQAYTTERDSRYSTRPQELVIEIELPLAKSASSLDLDVYERQLTLRSKKPSYHLDIRLPFPVKDDEGKASFDKAKKVLTVVLPVVQPVFPMEMRAETEKIMSESNSAVYNEEVPGEVLCDRSNEHGASMTSTAGNEEQAQSMIADKGIGSVTRKLASKKEAGALQCRDVESNQSIGADTGKGTCANGEADDLLRDNRVPVTQGKSELPSWKLKQRHYELTSLGKDFSCTLDADVAQVFENTATFCNNSNFQILEQGGDYTQIEGEDLEQMDDLPGMFKLPPFVCDQDTNNIYVRLLVNGVILNDVSLGLTDNKVSVSFPSDASNPLSADWCLLLQTVEDLRIDPDMSNFDINEQAVCLTLKKRDDCQGDWDRIMAGCSQKSLKEIFFATDIGIASLVDDINAENKWFYKEYPQLEDDNHDADMEEKLESLLNEQENSLWKSRSQGDNGNNEHTDPVFVIGDQQDPLTLQHTVQKDPGVNNEVLKRNNHSPIEHRTSWSQGSGDDISLDLQLEELDDDVVLDDVSPRDLVNENMRPVIRSQSYDCTCASADVRIKPILKRCQSLTYEDVRSSFSSTYSSADSVSEDEPQGRRRHKSVSFDMKPTVHEFIQLSRNQWRKQRKAQRKQEALSQLLQEEKEKHEKLKQDLQENKGNKEEERQIVYESSNSASSGTLQNQVKSEQKETMEKQQDTTIHTIVKPIGPPSSPLDVPKNSNKSKKKKRKGKGSQTSSDEEDRLSDKNVQSDGLSESQHGTDEERSMSYVRGDPTAKDILTNSLMFELET